MGRVIHLEGLNHVIISKISKIKMLFKSKTQRVYMAVSKIPRGPFHSARPSKISLRLFIDVLNLF